MLLLTTIMKMGNGINLKISNISLFFFLILFLFKTSVSYSSTIKDFTIEGISLGDSVLNFFSREEILNNKMNYYKKDDYITIGLDNHPSLKQYDWLQISYKKNDKNFIVESLDGVLSFDNDYNGCLKKKSEIVLEIKDMTGIEPKEYEDKHRGDPSGKSKFSNSEFYIDNDVIVISCIDWSKKMEERYFDHLKVIINSYEFSNFLRSNPY